MKREFVHLFFAAAVCVAGALTWQQCAAAHLRGACTVLALRITILLDAAGSGFVEATALRAAAEEVAGNFFRLDTSPQLHELLLASAVLRAIKSKQLQGIDAAWCPSTPSNTDVAQHLIDRAIGTLQTRPEAIGDDWLQRNGPALTALNLADALDRSRPLAAIYAYRAAILCTHPQRSQWREAIRHDLSLAREADAARSYGAMCRHVEDELDRVDANATRAALVTSSIVSVVPIR